MDNFKLKYNLRKRIRNSRKHHKYLGLSLAFFIIILSVTGALLAWKKDLAFLQPTEQQGSTNVIENWLPISTLKYNAEVAYLLKTNDSDNQISRVDIRFSKGIAKFIFDKGYWEVQIDCGTGEMLSIGKRWSDLIESIHDGSIIGDTFKLISMNVLGIAITFCSVFGFMMWYLSKKYRKTIRVKAF